MQSASEFVEKVGLNFIEKKIAKDLASGFCKKVITRFPPEPNGFLHLGHAKSICLNFGLAQKYDGVCHLRMDDTNPESEENIYIKAIQEDVAWLGYQWNASFHASDYFEKMAECALSLIRKGLAYVDHQSFSQINESRGTLKLPGINSPYRSRSIEENLIAFEEMKNGVYGEGEAVLRGKIDMASSNMCMRDPVFYRIKKQPHPHRGSAWIIYPMYDFAHCISDAIEGITHSLCTLEFQSNRALYDWILGHLDFQSNPKQYEFARLNLQGTVLSKRKLNQIVDSGLVSGWDDPRMPTLAGIRRKGVPPEALRIFCENLGISKQDSGYIELEAFEGTVRHFLNAKADRAFAILDPIKLTLLDSNSPQLCWAPRNPMDPSRGQRALMLTSDLYISRDDFREHPIPNFKRLVLGGSVRLRYGCVIQAVDVIKNTQGNIVEIKAKADWGSFGKESLALPKTKGVIHWISQAQASPARFRLYEPLFEIDSEAEAGLIFNKSSLTEKIGWVCSEALKEIQAKHSPYPCQFEREGYYQYDVALSTEMPLFHRTVALKRFKS